MLFNTFSFLVFFGAVWVVQAALPHRPRNLFLLGASWFFYGCWDWRFLSLILVSTAVDYACGKALGREQDPSRRKWIVTCSLVVNLGILAFFKYAGFFVESAVQFLGGFGIAAETWRLDVVLPVGISFYTFQTLSYTIDVYRRRLAPLRDPIDFALYVAFFPQLVAGPIERAEHLAPQMTRKPKVTLTDWREGGWLILWGLWKKTVLADNLAPIVDSVYGNPASASGPEILIATYAFAFQIYADFSGYTDIARGTARWLGYDLRINFNLPYFATGLRDFWRRWHISLSTWLRDYLYIPVGGNRRSSVVTARNLFLTMILGGLWHGAAWTFVVWGAVHGAFLGIERACSGRSRHLLSIFPPSFIRFGSIVVTFHFVCFAWVFFRAESLADAQSLLSGLFRWSDLGGLPWLWVWQLGFLVTPLLVVQVLQWRSGNHMVITQLSTVTRGLVYAMLLWQIVTLGVFGEREFLYFQF